MTTGPASDDPRLRRLGELIAASPHNLVSAEDRAQVLRLHIAEGLAMAADLAPHVSAGRRWVDLGTGGGLPGLVLATTFPDVRWVLVESVRKKAGAVAGFASELGLDNVEVLAERAEVLARGPERGACEGVVARAVAPLAVLVELARGFVGPGGWLVAVKGPAWEEELARASRAVERCAWADVRGRRVTSAPRPTWLVTMRADGAPPVGVPRGVGVPGRRPL